MPTQFRPLHLQQAIPRLVGTFGGPALQWIALERFNTLGRAPTCSIQLDDNAISKVHCTIELFEGAWHLIDSSSNGTFVNGEKVKQHVLRDADDIAIGNTRFFFATSRPPGDVTQINQPGLGFEKE